MRLRPADHKKRGTEIRAMQNDAGFTIIEVVIAISILAVGLLGVAAMQTSAIQVNSAAGLMTTRMNWAQDKMEELKAQPFSDPWLEAAGNPPGVDSAGNTHEQTTSDGYTVRWDIADNTPVPNTKRIVVTVTGKGKTSQLTCMKSDW
ncbi:MAG: prepilin-type N-terminal cleavage/methylation domain-containing protein [Desulfobacterales bacterium]